MSNTGDDSNVTAMVDARQAVYGDKVETYRRIAEVWSGILGYHINPTDVPLMMMGLKLVRTQNAPDYSDNSDDIEGYLDIFRAIVGDDMVHARTVSQYIEIKQTQADPAALMPEPVAGRLSVVPGMCAHCEEPEALHDPLTRGCQRTGFTGNVYTREF